MTSKKKIKPDLFVKNNFDILDHFICNKGWPLKATEKMITGLGPLIPQGFKIEEGRLKTTADPLPFDILMSFYSEKRKLVNRFIENMEDDMQKIQQELERSAMRQNKGSEKNSDDVEFWINEQNGGGIAVTEKIQNDPYSTYKGAVMRLDDHLIAYDYLYEVKDRQDLHKRMKKFGWKKL